MIRMYWKDHNKPHFHATYSGQKAVYQISPLKKMVKGTSKRFSPRANRLVLQWANEHLSELLVNWELVSQHLPGNEVEGLR